MVLQKLLVLNSIIQSSKNPTYVTRSTLWKLGVTFLRKYWVAFSVGCPKDKKTKTPPQKKKKKKKSIQESSLFRGWVPKQQILSCEEAIMQNYY